MEKITIEQAAKDLSNRTSLFQLQCFVLGKEYTIQSKLHQCVLEYNNRKDTLKSIEREISEQKDQILLLEIDLERKLNRINIDKFIEKENEIFIRKFNRTKESINDNIMSLEKRYKNIEEECLFFSSAFDRLLLKESLKQWDDPDVQKEYWNEKLRQEINLSLLLRTLPDKETLRTVIALPDDSALRRKTIEMLKNVSQTTENKAITN